MNKPSSETKLSRSPSIDGKQPAKQDEKESKSSSKKESSESKVSRSSSVDSKSSKSDESKPNKLSESKSKNSGESIKNKSQDTSSKLKPGDSKASKTSSNENKNTKNPKSNEKSTKIDNEKKSAKKTSKEFSEKSKDKSKDKKDDENKNKNDKNIKIKGEKKSSSDNKEPVPSPEPKPKKKISSQKDSSQANSNPIKQAKDGKASTNHNDNITVDQLFLAIEPETIDNPCLVPTYKYELLLETNIPVQGLQENIAFSHFIPSTHLRNINYYFNQRSQLDKDYFKDLSRINQLITPTSQYFNEYTKSVIEMQKNELYKRQLDNIEQFNSFIEVIHDSKVPFSNFIPT